MSTTDKAWLKRKAAKDLVTLRAFIVHHKWLTGYWTNDRELLCEVTRLVDADPQLRAARIAWKLVERKRNEQIIGSITKYTRPERHARTCANPPLQSLYA